MADEQNEQTPEEQPDGQHAVPSEDATEIAGSAEDAALEAAQEAQESPGGITPPEPASVEAAGEGHAVPSEEAQEIAGSVEDAPLEAAQEAAEELEAEEEDAAPRPKPVVPGAHLEVDIVPEGADPLR